MPSKEEELSLQEQAYASLLTSIINCEIIPGQKISLRTLEETYGYGRTPLRESLVRLVQQGIVYTIPQSGTYVSKINMREAENARYVRESMETNVVVECCARASREDIESLSNLIDRQIAADYSKDAGLFFELDNEFHEELYRIAGRHDIWHWIDAFSIHLNRYRRVRLLVADMDTIDTMRQHKAIYDAIKARDTDGASYLTHAHLHLMTREKDEVLKAYPAYFEI